MSKTLVMWFFLFFSFLTYYSAYGRTCTAETGNSMHGMIMGSGKPCIKRRVQELHAAQQRRISRLGKGAAYRGPSNSRPRNVRNASNSYSIKPPSLFMVAVGHLVLGLLLVSCFYRNP